MFTIMMEEHSSNSESSNDDHDIAISKEQKDEDLRTRIMLIVTQIKRNRNRPCYQSIHDHLKRDMQYQEIDKNSVLIPFIDNMVNDGHLKNTGREKESFLVVSDLLSKDSTLDVPNPRRRRRRFGRWNSPTQLADPIGV